MALASSTHSRFSTLQVSKKSLFSHSLSFVFNGRISLSPLKNSPIPKHPSPPPYLNTPISSSTMPINKDSTPPPVIGKAGRYTVFLTPPTTPKPSSSPPKTQSPKFQSPKSESPRPKPDTPKAQIPVKITPPVQPPPQQFVKSTSVSSKSDSSGFGFFWNAVAKVQNAHSSLDSYLAEWFGLDHSKYQWALDDYYESKGMEKGDAKPKEFSSKGESV